MRHTVTAIALLLLLLAGCGTGPAPAASDPGSTEPWGALAAETPAAAVSVTEASSPTPEPTQEAPAQETPAQETPAQETPTQAAPALLPESDAEAAASAEQEDTMIYLYIGEDRAAVTLTDNASAEALRALLTAGDLTYTADDYGGFEKVGEIPSTLPTDDSPTDTVPGDVILYQGNRICLYYGTNFWDFTRLGRIEGLDEEALRSFLRAGQGEIEIRLSTH